MQEINKCLFESAFEFFLSSSRIFFTKFWFNFLWLWPRWKATPTGMILLTMRTMQKQPTRSQVSVKSNSNPKPLSNMALWNKFLDDKNIYNLTPTKLFNQDTSSNSFDVSLSSSYCINNNIIQSRWEINLLYP